MKTNFKLLAMAAVAMLSMNSCNQDEEVLNNPEQKGEPVEFVMGINSITKTLTEDNSFATSFVEGDSVGIFVIAEDGTTTFTNEQYKLKNGKWVAQGNGIYAESGKTYKYYAYYPYNAAATDITSISLSVATDQSNDYNSSDALIAKNEAVTAGTTEVALSYEHAFSLVQVELSGDEAKEGAIVALQGIKPTASINLQTSVIGDASAPSGVVDVTMKPCATPLTYRAIVPKQTIAANSSLLKISSLNKEYSFTYDKDVPYEQGKLRLIKITLGTTTTDPITIAGAEDAIKAWEESEDLDGQGTSTPSDIERFKIPTGAGNDTIVMAYSVDPSKVENQTGDFWFYRTDKKTKAEAESQGTITIETDETHGNVIKIDNKISNSFYKVAAGYYLTNSGCSLNKRYKLSFKVKGAEGAKVLSAIRISNSGASAVVYNSSGDPTTSVSTTTIKTADTWEDGGTTFDFSKKSNGVGAIPGTNNAWSATSATEDDVTNIDIRIYPSAANTTVYIADVKLEEVTE